MSRGAGLFLDLDGTLADSLTAMRGVYDEFLRAFGVCGSDAEFATLNGPPLVTVVDTLRTTHGLPGRLDTLVRAYGDMVIEAQAAAPPATGAAAVLRAARGRGVRVAVVSSGTRGGILRWLARTGLDALVDEVVGGDEVGRGKPDPAPYRLALHRLGCGAARSLAVEDSPQGARAAVAAGLPTWVLTADAAAAVQGAPQYRGQLAAFADLMPHLEAVAAG